MKWRPRPGRFAARPIAVCAPVVAPATFRPTLRRGHFYRESMPGSAVKVVSGLAKS